MGKLKVGGRLGGKVRCLVAESFEFKVPGLRIRVAGGSYEPTFEASFRRGYPVSVMAYGRRSRMSGWAGRRWFPEYMTKEQIREVERTARELGAAIKAAGVRI